VDSAVPLPALPTGIAGLDTQRGLRRVVGKQALYLDLLARFSHTQDQVPAQIRGALAQGDAERARRLAHTLRGLAGNLGAEALQAQAAAVEDGIAANAAPPVLESALQGLAALLDPLVAALRAALPAAALPEATPAPTPTTPPVHTPVHTPAHASAQVPRPAAADAVPNHGHDHDTHHHADALHAATRLLGLLEQGDGDAAEHFRDHRAALDALLGPACAALATAMDGFDLDAAAGILSEALQRRAGTLPGDAGNTGTGTGWAGAVDAAAPAS
jgi:two-component system sensor histidine kinase/response regulator